MVKDNNYVEQLKGMFPQYLDILGVSTKGPFKCLNPNHMDKTPSMSFDAKDGLSRALFWLWCYLGYI